MYNLDTYNNYLNTSLPKAGPGGKVKGIKEFLKKFLSSSKNAKLKDLYKLSNQTGTVNNDFINKMKTLKISPDKFIESGKSPVSNDFVKLFSDRTWINRFGRDFSGVDEYNSLINLFKALPKHTAKPKQLLIDPLSNQPFGYNMAYHPKGDLYQSTFRNMATDIFPDIQNQMKYLNKHGIYHGDLKLNNIVLDENNVWKLIDPVGYPHASNLSSDVLKKIQQQEQARLKLMEEFLKKKKDGGEELPKASPGGWIKNLMKLFSRSPKNKNINLKEFLDSKNLNIEDLTKTQGTPGSSLAVYNLGDDAVLKVPVSGQQRNRGIFANAFEPSPELVKTNRTTKIINRGDDFITTEKIIPYKPSSHSKVWSMDESKLLNDWASNWNFEGGLRYGIKDMDLTVLLNGLSNPSKYGQSEGFKKVYAQLVKNLKANNMEEFLNYPLEMDFFKPGSWGKRTNIPYGKSTTEDFVNFDFGSIVGRNNPTMEKFFQNLGIRKEGGDLPEAGPGGKVKSIKKVSDAVKKLFAKINRKALPEPEFNVYRREPVISGKNYSPGNPFVYHWTPNKTSKLDWDFLNLGTTPGYLEKLGVKGTPTHGRYKGIWGFNSNYPIHANPFGGYEPWLGFTNKSKSTLDKWGNPLGYGHRLLQYQFKPDARILDLSNRNTSAIIKNAKHHQALIDEGYNAILGDGETILLNANKVDNVYEMRNLYNQEMLKNFPDMFPVFKKEGGDLPKANLGGPKKWMDAIKKIFGSTDDILPNYNLTFNTIQDDLLLNQMKMLEKLKMQKSQLPFNQKIFYHGSRDPELIIKNMIKGRQLRGKNVKTGAYSQEISPITGKSNFNLDQPGNALWWTPRIEQARGFHPHTYQANLSNIKNPYYMTTNTGNREWSYDEIKKLIDEGYDAVIMNAKEKDPSSWFSASEIIPLDNLRVIQNLKKIQKKGGEQKYGIDRLLKNLENYKNKITVTKNTKRNKKVGSEYYIEIPHPSIKNQKLRVGSVNTNNSGGISGINIKDKFSTMGINTLLHNLAS